MPRHRAGQRRHPRGVPAQHRVPYLDQVGEHLDRGEEGLLQAFVGACQFGGARLHLFLEQHVDLLQFLVLLLDPGAQLFAFALQHPARQAVTHDRQQLFVVPGLGNETVDLSAVDRLYRRRQVGIAGEQHPYRSGPARARAGKEFRTVHFRHAHVGNDQIDRRAFEQHKRFGRAFSGMDGIPLRSQQAAERSEDVAFVIHAQHRKRRQVCGRKLGAFH